MVNSHFDVSVPVAAQVAVALLGAAFGSVASIGGAQLWVALTDKNRLVLGTKKQHKENNEGKPFIFDATDKPRIEIVGDGKEILVGPRVPEKSKIIEFTLPSDELFRLVIAKSVAEDFIQWSRS